MRPRSLTIEGFSSFREQVVIDFNDVDLVGIVGSTGSGKSSILDAMTFALFGSVPRLGKGSVGPIVNSLSKQARLSLEFEVEGTSYVSTRVVKRTATGASNVEIRLESGEEVVASGKKEMEEAISQLLGLSYEQFTRTIVLPQGEFAAFLKDQPADRQKLLRRLLGIELYERMGKRARAESTELKAEIETIEQTLEAQAVPSKADIKDKARQAKALEALLASLSALVADVGQKLGEQEDLQSAIDARTDDIDGLLELEVPEHVGGLGEQLIEARKKAEEATEQATAATVALEEARQSVDDGPNADVLRKLVDDHQQHADLEDEVVELGDRAAKASEKLESAQNDLDAANAELEQCEETLRNAESKSGATALIDTLKVGENCPVCDQVVDNLPSHKPDRELKAAKKERTAAKKAASDCQNAFDKLNKVHLDLQSKSKAKADLQKSLEKKLAGEPSAKEAAKLITEAEALQQHLDEAIDARKAAKDAAEAESEALDELAKQEQNQRGDFTSARDQVSHLEPPVPAQESLAKDWDELVAWAQKSATALKKVQEKDQKALQKVGERLEKAQGKVDKACEPFLDGGDLPADPVASFDKQLGIATSQLASMEERVAEFEQQKAEIDGKRHRQKICETLGALLRSNGFEQWIMEEALRDLGLRATERLLELSDGQYSLATKDTSFLVVDHRNADEERPVHTLSGGETFLTSLSLALALSENIAAMATNGGPPLESIFLDEGFGTLDADTLDTVASAMEELSATGRMVGVITHIRDLADRMPIRFEVSKNSSTSSVERVEN